MNRIEYPIDAQCTIDSSQIPTRTDMWRQLSKSIIRYQHHESTTEFQVNDSASVNLEINQLMALELDCCSHLSFTLVRTRSIVFLTIQADLKLRQFVIDELFAIAPNDTVCGKQL